ncbi:MAG: hypothetical protein A2341_15090 [Deltaproteobacteria bacterium RIFOXYB12_FULL_58_9]|nr:MAG: hypothetical protein A2341_15090 [Deltaproteobacteria bacterium RIFOXYB12_FULL_58_9]
MMFFSDSWLLWILGPLYLLWVSAWIVMRLRRRGSTSTALRFPTLKNLQRLKPSRTLGLRRLFQGLRLLSVALILVAMARPQTGRTHTRVTTEGIDIMLVLDTSGSMQALDLGEGVSIADRKNRLEVVKEVVARFIEKRENDQIGMVVFGEQAFTQCPLTLDHGIVATFLDRVEIGMAGDRTAVGSALGTAVKRLQKSKAKSKVVILLTDGRNNAGSLSPATAAEIAKTVGVKVYTVGAGKRGKAPFLVDTVMGKHVAYQDESLDEELLKKIAMQTGGQYFRAEDRAGLESIYGQIDELERTEVEMSSYQEYNEKFPWFVLPALILLLIEVVLLGTRFRKVP